MTYTKLELFSQPSDDLTLWRYMDLSKLLALLETKSLYFPRADTFEDPYEGTLSNMTVNVMRAEGKKDPTDEDAMKLYLQGLKQQKRQMYISCWYASKHESAAMWKLYLQGTDGVAIKTSYTSLVNVLESSDLHIRTTMIRYVDYESNEIPLDSIFSPFVHKRISFEHEQELRAIIWAEEEQNRRKITENALGVPVKIDLDKLIQAIHVSPSAPQWFGDVVLTVMKKYGMSCPVECSNLYKRPIY